MTLRFFFFVVWGKGSGGLAIAIPLTVAVICAFATPLLTNLKYGLQHRFILGFLLSAVIIWLVGKQLEQPATRMDAQTGDTWEVVEEHSLYSIPVKYWAIIWVLFALLLFVNLPKTAPEPTSAPSLTRQTVQQRVVEPVKQTSTVTIKAIPDKYDVKSDFIQMQRV
jgi:hypothetical protein